MEACHARSVAREQAALGLEKPWELLELSTAERGVEVGHTVVVADLIVVVFPAVRHFRGGRQVPGAGGQIGVIREDRTAAAGGNGLVAIEAQGSHHTEGSGMSTCHDATEGFGRVLDERETEIMRHREQALDVGRVAEHVHRHERAQHATGSAIHTSTAAQLGGSTQIVAQGARIKPQSAFLTIRKVRQRPAVADGVGGRHERQGRHEHFVVLSDARQA